MQLATSRQGIQNHLYLQLRLEIVYYRLDLDSDGFAAVWLIQEFKLAFRTMIRKPLLLRIVYRYPPSP